MSRPKALQRLGCNWALAEYYDWVLRQLNDSRTAKGVMGAAALWVLSKCLSEITAVFQEKNSVKTLKSLDEVTMKPIYQLNPSAKSKIRCLAMNVKSLSLTEQRVAWQLSPYSRQISSIPDKYKANPRKSIGTQATAELASIKR